MVIIPHIFITKPVCSRFTRQFCNTSLTRRCQPVYSPFTKSPIPWINWKNRDFCAELSREFYEKGSKNSIQQYVVKHNTTYCCELYFRWVIFMYERIKQLRENAHFTQRQIAQKLNCSQQAYSAYELGQRDIPTDILCKLARIYDTTTDYILDLSDKRQREL